MACTIAWHDCAPKSIAFGWHACVVCNRYMTGQTLRVDGGMPSTHGRRCNHAEPTSPLPVKHTHTRCTPPSLHGSSHLISFHRIIIITPWSQVRFGNNSKRILWWCIRRLTAPCDGRRYVGRCAAVVSAGSGSKKLLWCWWEWRGRDRESSKRTLVLLRNLVPRVTCPPGTPVCRSNLLCQAVA